MRAKIAILALIGAGLAAPAQQLGDIVQSGQGRVGASAVILEDGKSILSFNASEHFPMQSVYKLPIGMAVLREVDRGKLHLDDEIHVEKSEYIPGGGHSPLRDAHPNGATVAVRELLRLAVSESDGSASDVLLRLIGGPNAVMVYLREFGIRDVQVHDTENRIFQDYAVQYRNWATPDSAVRVLDALNRSSGLTSSSRALLFRFLTETNTPSTRIKGLLPETAAVAHKTGSSGTRNGLTAATNDIGIVTLPDGRHLAIAVFVSDSRADDSTRDAVIAKIARLAWNQAGGPDRAVAVTIDDLPRGGDGGGQALEDIRSMTTRLLAPFREPHIPLTGFVVGRTQLAPTELRQILDLWLDAGADLGNHTYSHADLSSMPVAEYEQDMLKDDAILRPIIEARGKKLEFFRYPMLHAGKTAESKREIQQFLTAHGYRNAPVTFDDSDYMFALAYLKPQLAARVRAEYLPYLESVIAFFEQRSIEVAGREFPQILLLHASELNSQMMPQILEMLKRRGYRFVSLEAALKDDVYRLPENYVGPGGFSWIHRWSQTKRMPNKGEPDEPEWVRKVFEQSR